MKQYAEWHGPLWFFFWLLAVFLSGGLIKDVEQDLWIWVALDILAIYLSIRSANNAAQRYERNYGPWVKGKGRV